MGSTQDQSDSTHSVKLYAYDLSNGLARSMSLGWTGRQFEAIWHTSVVYDDQVEIFFGQGITTCAPGQSHHGKPLKIIDLGSTMIDPQTLMEYIDGLRQTWTADVYHLLEKNCNNFSNELVGFLNGASVPDYILNLPQEFLATPLGASMRPMIEQMFRGSNPAPLAPQLSTTSSAPNPAHLLADVASSAYSAPTDTPLVSCSTVSAFDRELSQHYCVVVNFTNERGCPPCRVIAPIYEELARKYHSTPAGSNVHHGRQPKVKDIKFIKVDTATSMELSQRYQIRATPTFKFFINKKEVGEMKGANQTELETQINLMVYTAYPPHPHLKLRLPKLKALSPSPILYPQVFNFEKALNKLLDSFPSDSNSPREVIKQTFEWVVIPFLNNKTDLNSPDRFLQWARATTQVLDSLGSSDSFPALDFLRLAVLREEYVDQLFICPPDSNPLYEAIRIGNSQSLKGTQLARPFSLTLLRLLSNGLGAPKLAEQMIERETQNEGQFLRFVVGRLLDGDVDVQVLASGVFYGLVSRWASIRPDWQDTRPVDRAGSEEEWEVESMSALVESLDREAKKTEPNSEMIYRLIATIGKLVYLSESSSSLQTLLESLGFQSIIDGLMNNPGLLKANPAIKDLGKELESVMSS
ncbi:hypothetical protein PGT21_013036 [Puccinia graminis f. sp. tritici]|uniref:PPPDE domain-containing protein n=1 Tax=Puccinia graminis f. sp. tritici TaxID=56615 RepID=A0A5B0P8Q3_PUCGR|nr:hypothetical protein PGT21_013036 [Puccinia graminis f. sp. tritici]KAA1132099.1 hypothetical protein PGTUg99_037084 [Puccinia graminis f. sp. tritici]